MRWLTVALAAVLVATVGVPAQADPGVPAGRVAAQDPVPEVGEGLVASDVVAAGVAAKVSGERVEVLSERDEFSTTWVNPDGSFTTAESQGQIRFEDEAGEWVDVDLELQALPDGSVAPVAHPDDLVLTGQDSTGGDTDLVAVSEQNERGVVVGLGKNVPEPVLEGSTATYPGVWPGVDVVVDARRNGFEQTFVLADAEAAAGLPGGNVVSWSLPVKTRGLTAGLEEDGSVSFKDSKRNVVSRLVAPWAWDAVVDEQSGLPTNRVPVSLGVTQQAKGKATVTVSVDRAWVLDPARVFPVTVDPTYASATTAVAFDTRAVKGIVTPASLDDELWVGTYNSGTNIARSYLNVSTAPFKGKTVMSASLSLYESWAWSCTATPVAVHEAGGPVDANTVWTNKPTHVATAVGQVNAAKRSDGSGTCGQGRVEIPMTSLAQSWAAGSATQGTVVVKAPNEADNAQWKKFDSAQGAYPPVVKWTYNRAPSAPVGLRLSSGTSVLYTNPANNLSQTWTSAKRPVFQASTSDPDANAAKISFQLHTSTAGNSTSLVAYCTTGLANGGTVVGCAANVDIPDGAKLYLRAKSIDTLDAGSPWSGWKEFYSSRSAGATPVISCPAPYADGSWLDTAPTADVTCTVSGAGTSAWDANGSLQVQVDEGAWTSVPVEPSLNPSVAKTTVTVPKTTGGHTVRAVGLSRAFLPSAEVDYGFGYGVAGMDTPVASPRVTTTGTVAIKASAPKAGSGQVVDAQVRYRVSGTGKPFDDPGWHVDPAGLTVAQVGGQSVATGTWDSAAASVNTATGADERVPVVLDVQVCFTYGAGVTKCTGAGDPTSVFRVPHAFGNGFPTADAGAGQVALFTGEFTTTVTDVSVPGYAGDLSIARSHSTYAGPTDATTGVFGPGWAANLDGAEVGLAGAWVVDNTYLDGSVVIVDGDGSAIVFDAPNGRSRQSTGAANLQAGTYAPGSADTALSGLTLKVSGTGTGTTVAITDLDGTVTTFTASTAPTTTKAAVFAPASVAEVGVPGATTYHRDGAGRVTRIVAPTPPGVSCPATGVLVKGCRAMDITYATSTTATATAPGDVTGQVKTVSAVLWDPASATVKTTAVATYQYNSAKRLVSVADPRTGLTTAYSYDSAGRLASVTPPGRAPVTLTYIGGTGTTPAQLTAVSRGGVQQARFIYGINAATAPLSGLPDMRTTTAWGQAKPPTYGAAVFGADKPVTATTPGGVGAGDWAYAALSYTDARGYTLNEASYGAGQWAVEAADYDERGNVIREWDASAVAHAGVFGPVPGGDQAWSAQQIATLATVTTYNATDVVAADGTVLAPAGSRVIETLGPARPSVVPGIGVTEGVRPREVTTYDQGAPNGGLNTTSGTGYNLPTTTRTTAAGSTGADLPGPVVLTETTMSYAPVVAGDTSGWTLGSPTKTTTGGITEVTRYDAEGGVIETRQPSEATTGTGPGTRKSTYYTAGVNSVDAACGNRPEWAGLACRTWPAATVSTGLPDERTTGYSMWLSPTTVVETFGSATRTTTSTYDTAGRVTTEATTLTGVAGSTPVPRTQTLYSATTGEVTSTKSVNSSGVVTGTETYGYDSFGRPTTYTNQLGDTTATTYTAAGQVGTVTDPKGTTAYTYDGADAAGVVERRGLPTKVTQTFGGRTQVMTAGYDTNGTMTRQDMPGGVVQTISTDAAGEPEEMFYSGPVTDPDTGATSTGPWLGWHLLNDPLGRVATESTPAGAVFDGSDTGGDGTGGVGDGYGYERSYTYDGASRLTRVVDKTATGYTGSVLDPDTPAPASCQQRDYAFDVNSNRTGLTTAGCDGTGATAKTWAYNAGDAATTGANGQGAYVSDAFGRQTTIPAVDTPYGSSNLTLGYYDTDAPKSVAGPGVTTSFTLDVHGRRLTQTSAGQGPLPDGATPQASVTRHYTDDSDNPGWVETGGVVTKFAPSLAGDLGIQMTSGTGGKHELTLANPHGDIVTTVAIPATGPVSGITAWADYTEYGGQRDPAATRTIGGPLGYGWLGAKERASASETYGLTLMGARYYNPTTGRFTSLDPVYGGNANTYTYPTDPVNMSDTSGQACTYRGLRRICSRALFYREGHYRKPTSGKFVAVGRYKGWLVLHVRDHRSPAYHRFAPAVRRGQPTGQYVYKAPTHTKKRTSTGYKSVRSGIFPGLRSWGTNIGRGGVSWIGGGGRPWRLR